MAFDITLRNPGAEFFDVNLGAAFPSAPGDFPRSRARRRGRVRPVFSITSAPVSDSSIIVDESGNFLVTEAGDYIIWQ